MARYDELDAYRLVYDTLLKTYRQIKAVPREIRYTLLETLRNDMIEVLLLITEANSRRDKTSSIKMARRTLQKVKLRFRLLKDLKNISDDLYGEFSEQMVLASKQLAGWQRYAASHSNDTVDSSNMQ